MRNEYYQNNHYKVGNVKFTLDHDGLEQAIDCAHICRLDVECIRNRQMVDIVCSWARGKTAK